MVDETHHEHDVEDHGNCHDSTQKPCAHRPILEVRALGRCPDTGLGRLSPVGGTVSLVPIRRRGLPVGILFRLPASAGGGEVSHSGLVRPPAKRVEV